MIIAIISRVGVRSENCKFACCYAAIVKLEEAEYSMQVLSLKKSKVIGEK
jgi:hypothetical protein